LTDGRVRTGCGAASRCPTAQARRLADVEGQGLVEYGLILVIMALVCVISLVFFGDQLSTLLQLITSAV
jgi:Flp pilus assembly pilin Flp